MPTLDFKGKQHIYAHHLTVPYRPLIADESKSVAANGTNVLSEDAQGVRSGQVRSGQVRSGHILHRI